MLTKTKHWKTKKGETTKTKRKKNNMWQWLNVRLDTERTYIISIYYRRQFVRMMKSKWHRISVCEITCAKTHKKKIDTNI